MEGSQFKEPIATRRFAARPKDAEDIGLFEGLRRKREGGARG
jgi:hypothetical protein